MTKQIHPYLNFNGRCREAMQFYQECLGGELVLQKVAESPMAAQMPSEAAAQILHCSLTGERFTIMASDMAGAGLISGNAITLLLICISEEEIEICFQKLSHGGKVKTPLHQSFGGSTYGELIDKYGLNWQLNFSKN